LWEGRGARGIKIRRPGKKSFEMVLIVKVAEKLKVLKPSQLVRNFYYKTNAQGRDTFGIGGLVGGWGVVGGVLVVGGVCGGGLLVGLGVVWVFLCGFGFFFGGLVGMVGLGLCFLLFSTF